MNRRAAGGIAGVLAGGLGVPFMVDVARGVPLSTDVMQAGNFSENFFPGLQFYSDVGKAFDKATGLGPDLGVSLSSLGLAGAGGALGEKLVMSETRKAPTIFKSITGPGTKGFSISSGSSSSSVSSDIPLMLALLGTGAGAGALSHKMLTKESMAKYYYSLS
jgi:hypothetical protein